MLRFCTELCIDDGPDEGTQVDCDEVFQELLKDCVGKNRLSLIILPVTLEWKKVVPDSSSSGSALGQFSSSTSGLSASSSSSQFSSSTSGSSASSSSSQPNSPGSVSPLQSFGNPSSCLTEGWSPLPMRDISLALDPVLKLLGGLYKPIFAQSVNREVIGDGFVDFVLKVYNAISYGKPPELKKRRGKRSRPVVCSDQESDTDDPYVLVNSCRNRVDYGCVAYNPPSPAGETPETQEDKRRLLLELAEDNSAEVNKLLRLTSASQRSEIIACKPLKKIATDFFLRWPHFKVAINLLQHA
ncbi:Mid1-interacting protein 1 [Frankliniella fusca]|uniref:Mid1-interacting protein 1 n=1 Tax=Frankliniella fusca TaxID=407009 RepID=A0AAE1LL32_9NEOP|nr:Mid1-interacting protein 1 [Frankliniella fusca]